MTYLFRAFDEFIYGKSLTELVPDKKELLNFLYRYTFSDVKHLEFRFYKEKEEQPFFLEFEREIKSYESINRESKQEIQNQEYVFLHKIITDKHPLQHPKDFLDIYYITNRNAQAKLYLFPSDMELWDDNMIKKKYFEYRFKIIQQQIQADILEQLNLKVSKEVYQDLVEQTLFAEAESYKMADKHQTLTKDLFLRINQIIVGFMKQIYTYNIPVAREIVFPKCNERNFSYFQSIDSDFENQYKKYQEKIEEEKKIKENHSPKIKTNLSVKELSYLFKSLLDLKPDIFDVKTDSELKKFISNNFITPGSEQPSINSLNKLFNQPDPKTVEFWKKHFSTLLKKTIDFK